MELTTDAVVVFTVGGIPFNATIVFTWIIMALLSGVSVLITRNLRADVAPGHWRTTLEVIVLGIQTQIEEITRRPDRPLLYFTGTLFLFIVTSNLLTVVPGFRAPTASLSTTVAARAGRARRGATVRHRTTRARGLPAHLRRAVRDHAALQHHRRILSRHFLAIRLYGNVMSGTVIVAILLGIAPFFFPVLMDMPRMLTGVIQGTSLPF